MRRYTARKDSVDRLHILADGINMTGLARILPWDVEKHVQMNRVRLSPYDRSGRRS